MIMNEQILTYPDSELGLKEKIENLNDEWLDFLKKQYVNESCNVERLFVSDSIRIIK